MMEFITRSELKACADAAAPVARRSTWPIEYGRNPVHVRGEALSDVLWRGRQWAVTTHGIEALDGTYAIGAARLREDCEAGGGFEWPSHMAEKEWVDLDDFATAWCIALTLHQTHNAGARDAIDAAFVVRRKPHNPAS